MKASKIFGIATAILFTALWALPLARAISLFREAEEYLAETNSMNASNDVWYSSHLLVSYTVSLCAGFALAWFIFWRPRLVFVLSFGVLLYVVIEIIRFKPEEPIVLIPTMHPWRPARISLAAVAVAALFHYGSRLKFPARRKD
ncbi:MAG: hypothetical protein JWM68_211 [Verrucomicrobiales bacterium]|nr:hypothetical protein [Verrucomicrobiales bacterium]